MVDERPTRPETGVSGEGLRLIQAWIRACHALVSQQQRLSQVEREVREAEQNLAKFLSPPDPQVGETVAIWVGDSLIQCTYRGKEAEREYSVGVRTRGKTIRELGG